MKKNVCQKINFPSAVLTLLTTLCSPVHYDISKYIKKEISKCLPSGKFLPIRQWWQKNSAYLDFTYFNNITVDVDFNQIEPIFIILWTKHGSLVKKSGMSPRGWGILGFSATPHPQIIFVPPSLNWICAPLINVCTPSHKLLSIIELMRLVINKFSPKLTYFSPN